jgi:antagonist of KipI
MDSGVPRAGAMDCATLDTLNALLGNGTAEAGIEWALSAGELMFTEATTFAVGGAPVDLALDGRPIEQWRACAAGAGQILTLGAPLASRFVYIAFAGGLEAPLELGSRSTYLPASLGGMSGRRLATGDSIAPGTPRRRRSQVTDSLPEKLRPSVAAPAIRYITRASRDFPAVWKVSTASDRTGYRLESDVVFGGASIISEPVCPGTIQVPPGGSPIVLMADAPTIGGYLIAGAIISADLGVLAQRIPGDVVELQAVSIDAAARALTQHEERLDDVRRWSLR